MLHNLFLPTAVYRHEYLYRINRHCHLYFMANTNMTVNPFRNINIILMFVMTLKQFFTHYNQKLLI